MLYWKRNDILFLKQHTVLGQQLELAITEILLPWIGHEANKLYMDTEQRYKKILNTMAVGLQLVPAKHIASFFGIHADSLSRIRERLDKKS